MKTPDDPSSIEPSYRPTWDAHRLDQLRMALRATPAQRLACLEEMMKLAHRFAILRPADLESSGTWSR